MAMACSMLAKFKHSKGEIRKWRNEDRRKENQEVLELTEIITKLEKETEMRSLLEDELKTHCNGYKKLLNSRNWRF